MLLIFLVCLLLDVLVEFLFGFSYIEVLQFGSIYRILIKIPLLSFLQNVGELLSEIVNFECEELLECFACSSCCMYILILSL